MRRLGVASAAALIVLTLGAAQATATAPTPASGQIWSPNQRVQYHWHAGNEPPQWLRPAINAAAQDSTDSRASRAAIFSYGDTGSSWISYTGDIPTTYAIGYTISYIPNYFTMRLRPQGYALDWGNLRWCQFYDSPPLGCYDAELIALHELGHAQTLDHPDDADVTTWTDTVMHWAPKTKAKAGWNQHEFGPCDVARLQIRYQPLTYATRISTCLNLATDLTLSVSSTTTYSGNTVTFYSRLNIDDGTIWPNLASDPLADRTVTIQRRPVGGTGWTSVTSMNDSDDNGRYAKTLTLSDTYDYRVVFNAPSNDGVQDSTSPIVRVTVYPNGSGCPYAMTKRVPHGRMLPC